jgi:hypothetical protein
VLAGWFSRAAGVFESLSLDRDLTLSIVDLHRAVGVV